MQKDENERPREDSEPDVRQHKPLQGLGRQILFSCNVGLGMFLMGYALAYTAPALITMGDPDIGLPRSPENPPLVGSLLSLGALFGCFLSGPLMDYFGRRLTTVGCGIPYIIGWLMNYWAVHWAMVHVARVICGLVVGITSVCMSVYMAESLQPELRGILGLIPPTVGNMGILFCYVVGKYLDWRILALLGAVMTVPYLIMSFILPESPHWLTAKGKHDQAKKALRWLRGGKRADIFEELVTINIAKSEMKKVRMKEEKGFKHLCTRRYRKPIAIAVILLASMQLVGIGAVIAYSVSIFKEAGTGIDMYWCATIVAAVKLVAAIGSNILIDLSGRRMLLLISSAGVFITMGGLGTFLFLRSLIPDLHHWNWVSLLCMVLYVITYSSGLGSVPWLMTSEILPAEIRGLAASAATGISWLCAFLVTGLFPIVAKLAGTHWSYWAYAVLALLTFLFVLFVVPETRERTLENIERAMAGLPPVDRPPTRSRILAKRSALPSAILRWSSVSKVPIKV